jgi:BirA family biotin operon repressor/biotin-[acetyl-CoA-carboxylase] ligase
MRTDPARVPEARRGAGARPCPDPQDGAPERLTRERVVPRLRTRWLGHALHWMEETDSTNRVAQELARAGAAAGTAVIAEGQTGGRGRLGRSFFSPPYLNLYTSIVLRPGGSTLDAQAHVLAAAVAVADAVAGVVGSPEPVEIKWPNDVLLAGLKVSGILLELGAETTRVAYLVLGIGVNLNVERESFPEEFRARACSLRSFLGAPVDRVAFTQSLYEHLESTLERCAAQGLAGVLPDFERWFRMRGRRVRVAGAGPDVLEGVALGVDASGALRLGLGSGETRVLAGDVTLLKEPA